MNLHLGCGNIFLDGFTNVDLFIPGYSFLAKDRPDLVSLNRTTLDHYYKHPYTTDGPVDRLCVVDCFMDARIIDPPEGHVDQIVAAQLLEHFTPAEAKQALRNWCRLLKPGGTLVVDVHDFPKLLLEFDWNFGKQNDYYYRMIFGSYKNEYACHKDGYDEEKLRGMLLEAGFSQVRDLGNILGHDYPTLTFEARK